MRVTKYISSKYTFSFVSILLSSIHAVKKSLYFITNGFNDFPDEHSCVSSSLSTPIVKINFLTSSCDT